MTNCPYCGVIHSGMCKAIDYHQNGMMKRVDMTDDKDDPWRASNLRLPYGTQSTPDRECQTCDGSGTIWVRMDGEVACPDCGYREPRKD